MISGSGSGSGSSLGKKLRKIMVGQGKTKKRLAESDFEDDHRDSDWMPSQDIGEETSPFVGNIDHDMEDASDEVEEFNHQAYSGHRKSWTASEYTRTRNV